MTREIVIACPVRTPIGNYNGKLKSVPATELGSLVVRETIARSGIPVSQVGMVVMGNVIQAGNGMNPARQASVGSGVPVSVPAMTVNVVCGSGAQAIIVAAQDVQLGYCKFAVAGGMENMDRAPYLVQGGRWGHRMGDGVIVDSMLCDGLNDAFSGEHSGWHTEDVVKLCDLSRDAQDRWAERSHRLFRSARDAGRFETQIVAVPICGKKGDEIMSADEAPRADTTLERLALLPAAFRADGTITAGNSPGLNSGASAMIVAERRQLEAHGIEPAARLVSWGITGVEPGLFGLGPVPAVRQALDRAGWKLSDIDRIEINEAFAAVPLAVTKELSIPEEIVNVEGGAIAHGHAIGATGAVLVTRLLYSMAQDGIRRGVVTLCIGGGQGIALVLERI
jgi:acetyl-CoA C-acetyltransferase